MAFRKLKQRLRLSALPRVMECFDVSIFQGAEPVASKVCFVDGIPDKSRYRRYNIKTVEGTDDFGMMYEAICRRLKQGLSQQDLPDLLFVDGGKGQLGSALAACKDLGIKVGPGGIEVASIAKARTLKAGEDKVVEDGRSVALDENAALITMIRPTRNSRLFIAQRGSSSSSRCITGLGFGSSEPLVRPPQTRRSRQSGPAGG